MLVRSLADAQPLRNVEVQLVARNNEILGTATTDGNGMARFDAGLARGKGGLSPASSRRAPARITASSTSSNPPST